MNRIAAMSVAMFSLAACAADEGAFDAPALESSPLGEAHQPLVGPRNAFRNVKSERCMGVDGASKASGAAIQQFACSASGINQRWVVLLEDVVEPVDPESGNLFRPLINAGPTRCPSPASCVSFLSMLQAVIFTC